MTMAIGTITLLFTDIVGSTGLWETRPDAMSFALSRHDELMRSAITSGEGVVFKTVGDAFCAAFGRASDAVAAALAAQRALAAESWPDAVSLRVRMGLHSGVCEERDGDYFGPTVNRAARLAAVAHGSQVIVSEATADLARDALPQDIRLKDLGRHRLKDLTLAEHVFQIEAEDLPAQFPPLRSLGNLEVGNNLPIQLTSFVGRRRELAQIRHLLETSRLVTITGVGGCGKTRAAIEALTDTDGVWFVDLAPSNDPGLVAGQIGAALGIQGQSGQMMAETLTDVLSLQNVCLVLDNCEHVIDACAELVSILLRSCPRIRLLITSREPLDVDGEYVYRLPLLSVPSGRGDVDGEGVSESEAVQLFVERGSAHRSGFVLNDANAPAIASICRHLDGIPLALELAAARLASFSVADLEARLGDRFGFLTSGRRTALPRHQTLRALVEWSYDLLTGPEQTLLRSLSVFAGGFTLDAAERLCAGGALTDMNIADLISSLTEKSLVQIDERTEPLRYRMLETIRQFSLERLGGHGEESSVRAAHAAVFVTLAETAAPHLWSAGRLEWLSRVNADEDNLREAMAVLLADPGPDAGQRAMRLFTAMSRYWEMTNQAAYVLGVASVLLSHPDAQERNALWIRTAAALALVWRGDNWELAVFAPVVTEAADLARELGLYRESSVMHWVLGGDLSRRGDSDRGQRLYDGAIEDARLSGDLTALGVALIASSVNPPDLQVARSNLSEALSCLRRAGDEYWEPTILNNLATADMRSGDRRSARELIDKGIALSRAAPTNNVLTTLLSNLADIELDEGDIGGSQAAFGEAIRLQIRTGLLDHVSSGLIGGIAGCASAQGELETAAFLYGAAHAVNEHAGIELGELVDHHEEQLREKMSVSAFNDAFARGHSLSPREALKVAQTWSDENPPEGPEIVEGGKKANPWPVMHGRSR
jgi:predicted ATPase/class 3 adenylate cyclase